MLNLLTARKEPEHNDEKAALDIREQLERELQKDTREDGAEKKDLEPEEPGIRTAEQSKEQSETKEVGKKEPEEESPDYLFYNVMEDLVEGKVEENLKRFDACTCPRCRADATALALNHISPKYVVVEKSALTPMRNFYENKYAAEILVALVQACITVAKNPFHDKKV